MTDDASPFSATPRQIGNCPPDHSPPWTLKGFNYGLREQVIIDAEQTRTPIGAWMMDAARAKLALPEAAPRSFASATPVTMLVPRSSSSPALVVSHPEPDAPTPEPRRLRVPEADLERLERLLELAKMTEEETDPIMKLGRRVLREQLNAMLVPVETKKRPPDMAAGGQLIADPVQNGGGNVP